MATVSERLALVINFNGDAAIKGLDGVARKAEGAHEETRALGDRLTKMGAMGVAAAGVAAVGLGKLAMGASDVNELVSQTGVLFGDARGTVEQFADGAASSLGQSKAAALEAANTFGDLGRATGLGGQALAGFSTNLVTLSSDLASFKNTSPEEAVLALGAALRGESEPIRRYGVLLDDATLKQRALDLGLVQTTTGTLPPAIKMQAAYAEIMAQTTVAQGDFGRTADGAANTQRILRAEMKNLADGIGAGVLPAFSGMLHGATAVVQKLNEMSPSAKAAIGTLAAGGTGAVAAVSGLSLIAGQVVKMKEKFTGAEGGLSTFGKASIVTGAAVAGLTIVMGALQAKAQQVEARIGRVGATMKELGVTAGKAGAVEFSKFIDKNKDAAEAADKVGLSLEALQDGLVQGGAAYEQVVERMRAYINELTRKAIEQGKSTGQDNEQLAAARQLLQSYQEQAAAIQGVTDKIAAKAKEQTISNAITDVSTKTIGEHRRAIQDDLDMVAENERREKAHAQALKDSEQAMKDLTAAQQHARDVRQAAYDDVRAQTDKEFAYGRAQRDTAAAARELADRVKAATDAKGKDAVKNDEAAAASDALVQQILTEAHAYAESTGAVDGSRDSIDKQVRKLGELRDSYAEKFPEIAAQIDTYIGKLKAAAAAATTLVVPGFEARVGIGGGANVRARGGPVNQGEAYVVGEQGPELVVPGADGYVVPNHNMPGRGGPQVNVTVHGVTDVPLLSRMVGSEVAWALKVGVG